MYLKVFSFCHSISLGTCVEKQKSKIFQSLNPDIRKRERKRKRYLYTNFASQAETSFAHRRSLLSSSSSSGTLMLTRSDGAPVSSCNPSLMEPPASMLYDPNILAHAFSINGTNNCCRLV